MVSDMISSLTTGIAVPSSGNGVTYVCSVTVCERLGKDVDARLW